MQTKTEIPIQTIEQELREALDTGTVNTMPVEALRSELERLSTSYYIEAEANNVNSGTDTTSLAEFDRRHSEYTSKYVLATLALIQLKISNRTALETLFANKS